MTPTPESLDYTIQRQNTIWKMARYDRSIKIAFDKTSGEILDADEVFDIAKDAFEIRKKYHEKKSHTFLLWMWTRFNGFG